MSDPPLTAADLGTYLGVDTSTDPALSRASLALEMAVGLCMAVVNPLPAGANAVVIDVASRAFLNPGNTQNQNAGPFGVGYGPVSGGLWLTSGNRATLRRLAGRSGGAFTIDMLPATAGSNLPWWDVADAAWPGDWDTP